MDSLIRLLIVDDSDEFRNLFKSYLKHLPIKILEANSGVDALALLKNEPIELAFIDNNMDGMSGTTVTRLYRSWEKNHRQHPSTIMALSAYSKEHEKQEFLNAGCDEYLVKPITREQLQRILTKVLHEQVKE